LGERTLANREFQWCHSLSGTLFDTLPDLVSVDVKLTYWHCLKAVRCTLVGNILVPKSANICALIRIHLWKHPYVAMKSYLQRMTIYNETGDTRKRISLCTTIRALGSTTHKQIHLLFPDWESGHSDLEPLSQRYSLADNTDPNPIGEDASTYDRLLDGGEALGRLGNRILGGHKMVKVNGSTATSKLHVTIIDHHMNQCTPWLANVQTTPLRLRILGDPSSRSIDTQIPTHREQTCREAIHLILQIIGSEQGLIPFENDGIQVFTLNSPSGGHAQPAPTESESTGLLLLQHHSLIHPNDRLMMFLPKTAMMTTWTSACLAADTDIRLSDGSFAPVQHSIGRNISTDQPHPRTIIRIHKFDTQPTDPPLCFIKGNGMTESHFIRGRMAPNWSRASEFVDDKVIRRATSTGPVFAVELDKDDHLTLRGDIQAATFGNCLIVEPQRPGYTQDFRFKVDQALRDKGLHRADLIEWHHGGIGHRADGSLLRFVGAVVSSRHV